MSLLKPRVGIIILAVALWFIGTFALWAINGTYSGPGSFLPSASVLWSLSICIAIISYIVASGFMYLYNVGAKTNKIKHHKNASDIAFELRVLQIIDTAYIVLTIVPVIVLNKNSDIFLIPFDTLLYGSPLLGLVNLIYMISFIVKNHPHGKLKVVCYGMILLSILFPLAVYVLFSIALA
jgi:hypothetical protein